MPTYTIAGMTCQHCVAAVTREIAALDDVRAVEVDLTTGVAQIEGNPTRAAVADAVDEAGYQLVDP